MNKYKDITMSNNEFIDTDETVLINADAGQQPADASENRLDALEKELDICKDQQLRMAAEFENFKKRMEREKNEFQKYVLEGFSLELLPFLDNLERAMQAGKDAHDINKLLEGLELTVSSFFKSMERFGLKPFTSENKPFDYNFHEALCTEDSPNHDEDFVIKELAKGYCLHDKVLRPAKVIVCKKNLKNSGQV